MSNKLESIFKNLTDEEFENFLKESGFEFKKVEKGKGGLFIGDKRVTIDDFNKYSLFK